MFYFIHFASYMNFSYVVSRLKKRFYSPDFSLLPEFHTRREKVEFLFISVTSHCFNSCVLSLRQRKNIFVLKKIIFIIIFLGGNSFFSVSEIK